MNARLLTVVMMTLALTGCLYEPSHTGLACSTDEECAPDAVCMEGFCVLGEEGIDAGGAPDAADMDAPTATRLEIAPETADVPIGVSVQLTATAFLEDGSEIESPTVSWTSESENIATVTPDGVVTGIDAGTTRINATIDGVSASALITVLAPVASIEIAPATPSLGKGRTLQLTARALDANGNELSGRTFEWSAADVSLAVVDSDGLLTALDVGNVDVTARSEAVFETVSVEITPNPVTSVLITPDDGAVELGTIREYTAEIRDQDDTVLDPRNRSFDWTITNAAVASLSVRGGAPERARVQGQSVGNTRIAVTVDAAVSDALDIEVAQRPVASVELTPISGPVPVGSTRQLTTTVRDPNGQELTGRDHVWASSDETVATVTDDGLVTFLAPGSVTLSATVAGLTDTIDVDAVFLVASMEAGEDHTCALNPDGFALCWGNNNRGQLGMGTRGGSSGQPVVVRGARAYTVIDAGNGFTCAIDGMQTAYCWGDGGRLGIPGGLPSEVPVAIPTHSFTAISAGDRHGCGVTTTNEIYCWGEGSNGELGDGSSTDSNAALKVDFIPVGNLTLIASGKDHTCASTDMGKTYCWGNGNGGALGNGGTSPAPTPVEVTGAPAFEQLSLGEAVSCGRTATQEVHCWGSNLSGRLGIGDMMVDSVAQPTALPGVAMTTVAFGSQHGCGVNAADGVTHCWGLGSNFRLGTNNEDTQYAPVAVDGALVAIDVAAGGAHACAIDAANIAYCWGNNSNGRVGTAIGNTVAVPTLVWPAP